MSPMIYVLKNKAPLSKAQQSLFMQFLSEERRNRVTLVRSCQKADSMLLAEVLVKTMVAKKFGLPLSSLTISYTEYGKPYFKDAKNIFFSLSHSENYIAAAIHHQPIGIDIQKIGNFPEKVAERICNKREYTLLKQSTDRATNFTKLWTQKEAVLKMQGLGIFSGDIKNALCKHSADSVQIENTWLSVATPD